MNRPPATTLSHCARERNRPGDPAQHRRRKGQGHSAMNRVIENNGGQKNNHFELKGTIVMIGFADAIGRH
jgi:hypothetical protein